MADFTQGQATVNFGGIQIGQQFETYRPIPKYLTENENLYWVPNRTTLMPKVDVQYIIQVFKQNLNFGAYTEYVARMMLRKFAEVAAKYSPPNIGKSNIEEKYYYRPIYNLVDMAKGLVKDSKGKTLHCTRDDYTALRKGLKFKIMNTKYRVKRGTVYAYTKGINEAKRLSRIENRGLTKYSWGSILNTFSKQNMSVMRTGGQSTRFGVWDEGQPGRQLERRVLMQTQLPPIFGRLQRKSPNIAKYRWGAVQWQEDQEGNNIRMTINNNLAEVEKYCQLAIRQGLRAAVKQATDLIWYIEHNAAKKIDKMFDFELYKVTKVTALHASTPAERNMYKGRKKK